jgi:hypothetical protein
LGDLDHLRLRAGNEAAAVRYVCPHCGTAIGAPTLEGEIRFGVRLTAFKARIFDIVRRAGKDGIATDDLWRLVYERSMKRACRRALYSHIHQINDLIEDTGWRIVGHSGWHHYRLIYQRVPQMQAAE